jgi:hypothetical protein
MKGCPAGFVPEGLRSGAKGILDLGKIGSLAK